MTDQLSNSKRVAKNTLMLYFRMILTTVVSLYTSRVVLQTLGVSDYGVYSVVGGFVSMVGVLSSLFVSSTQRYMSFALGKGEQSQVEKVFSNSVVIQLCIAVIVFLAAETFGLWFVNNRLVIEPTRMVAANWVYQAAVLSMVIGIISTPFNSCIIAHEHMDIYAYISIIDVLLRLGIVFLIQIIPFDKLVSYSILLVIVAITIRLCYTVYSKKKFEECRTKNHFSKFDKPLFKEMFAFAGWSFLGAMGFSFKDQFSNMMQNMFFGTTVNAARGLAMRVSSTVTSFSNNFMMALKPQITKQYASGDKSQYQKLVFIGSRLSFYLLSIIAIPVLINLDYLLGLWLVEVPRYTDVFINISLFSALVYSLSQGTTTAIFATGKIKAFEIGISIILLAELPIGYVLLKSGYPPYAAMLPAFLTQPAGLVYRFILLKKNEPSFSYRYYFINIVLRAFILFTLGYAASKFIADLMEPSIWWLLCNVAISVVVYAFIIFVGGMDKNERKMIIELVKTRVLNV